MYGRVGKVLGCHLIFASVLTADTQFVALRLNGGLTKGRCPLSTTVVEWAVFFCPKKETRIIKRK
jgi:hypothetical protein